MSKSSDTKVSLDFVKNEFNTYCTKNQIAVSFDRKFQFDFYLLENGISVKVDTFGILVEKSNVPVMYFAEKERYMEALEYAIKVSSTLA